MKRGLILLLDGAGTFNVLPSFFKKSVEVQSIRKKNRKDYVCRITFHCVPGKQRKSTTSTQNIFTNELPFTVFYYFFV